MTVIDADPVAAAVRALMAARTRWTGTAATLLGALAEVAGERVAKLKPQRLRGFAPHGHRRTLTFVGALTLVRGAQHIALSCVIGERPAA